MVNLCYIKRRVIHRATRLFYGVKRLSLIACYFTSSNIKYIDNQLVTVIKIQMICKCKYKTI